MIALNIRFMVLISSSINDDGENVKKNSFISKTTILLMQRNFWKLFVNSLHDYDVELPYFATETHDDLISFLFFFFFFFFFYLHSGSIPKISSSYPICVLS